MPLTLDQTWGVLLLLTLCPTLGALPLVGWIVQGLTGINLRQVGTGNVSVSAAFYHGGKWVGGLSALAEALKGVAVVLLTRQFFPAGSPWELLSLAALVMGRYWVGGGAGTTNAMWGAMAYDPISFALTWFLSFMGWLIVRDRQQGKYLILVIYPLTVVALPQGSTTHFGMAVMLCGLLGFIYQKVPDDLELSEAGAKKESRGMFRFFRGDRAVKSLDDDLQESMVGGKAATLSQLRRRGYPVPPGWVLHPGDDPMLLAAYWSGRDDEGPNDGSVGCMIKSAIGPDIKQDFDPPLIARSSAVGEDGDRASAAGMYESIGNIRSSEQLVNAIAQVFDSYDAPAARQYRQDLTLEDAPMAVLVQPQIEGVFSGVAFSRDPVHRCGDGVVVEALPGDASKVVSGRITPEAYRVQVSDDSLSTWRQSWGLTTEQGNNGNEKTGKSSSPTFQLNLNRSNTITTPIETVTGAGNVPLWLVQEVACLARDIEQRFGGIPQDMEWTFDGSRLWVLQARSVTTLLPIWTRKIAAEVIPGTIRPLTWSINRPLTCGVWGDLFQVVIGDTPDIDYLETATLHHSRAYFNVTLLGELFGRAGLPPDSLTFLTQGGKPGKVPVLAMVRAVPGLLRLIGRERALIKNFLNDDRHYFSPALSDLRSHPVLNQDPANPKLTVPQIIKRIKTILELLEKATYYSILAPLSVAVRQKISRVSSVQLDTSDTPEIASAKYLETLGMRINQQLQGDASESLDHIDSIEKLFDVLGETPTGKDLIKDFDQFLTRYGYLSDVGTDIAVPTWVEDPSAPQSALLNFARNPVSKASESSKKAPKSLQNRVQLRGRVTVVYSQLLAELRWHFVAIARQWHHQNFINNPDDIFMLTWDEVQAISNNSPQQPKDLKQHISDRHGAFNQDCQHSAAPLVYGNTAPPYLAEQPVDGSQLTGIGSSAGTVQGEVLILDKLRGTVTINRDTILVVPYTDSAWAPLLAQAGGLVCEVGGQLSHGAIVAREYGIPSVMNVSDATRRLRTGQRVKIDGDRGTVEPL
ncbi:MAG: glycerol-3-phosphate acyltransferase [Cyanophyceae cyanobacterium]